MTEREHRSHKLGDRRLWFTLLGASVLVGAIIWWWSTLSAKTNNARVEGTVYAVSARIDGVVSEVAVALHDRVATGDVLFRLDPRDYELALQRAQAELASSQAALRANSSQVPVGTLEAQSLQTSGVEAERIARSALQAAESAALAAAAELEAARAALEASRMRARRSERDRERLEPLAEKRQISEQQFDTATSTAREAAQQELADQARVTAAEKALAIAELSSTQRRHEVEAARAARRAAETAPQRVEAIVAEEALARARVDEANAALRRAELDLEDTTVRAPADGVIGRKSLELGQHIRRGEPVLALVGNDVWVEANFKETQIRRMAVGQHAKVTLDAYPGTLRGRIESIGPATGSRFSLLPADNTSGNFVKVVQRVAVKIAFDDEELARYQGRDEDGNAVRPLRPGMSAEVTVSFADDA